MQAMQTFAEEELSRERSHQMSWNMQLFALVEIVVAMFLGGMIGFEREMAKKPAGLRTHMLVAGGAALLVALGNVIVLSFGRNIPTDNLRSDPIRIIQAIIVGISFLGAGTIFQREKGEQIEGLTTSASILFTAGVGIAVALQQFLLAISSTILLLLITRILGVIENRIWNQATKKDRTNNGQ
jgi:putative Mg2+ transporter-C (MgtC) family protein